MNELERTHHVFVYGTLKLGYGNNRLLHDGVFVGPGITVRPFQMRTTPGFPVVFDVNAEPLHNIAGEVYEVNDEILSRLDQLEGHPRWYRRQEVVVDIADTGVQQTCWMYVGTPAGWTNRDSLRLCQVTPAGAFHWERDHAHV